MTRAVLPVIQRKHNQIIAQVKGFRESPKPSKKTAKLSACFNIPETGFFPTNKLISSSLRIVRLGTASFTIFVSKPRFYT
jgi:hypothetical protein